VEKYIYDENLKIFHKHLAEETDEKQRQLLRSLVAEQKAKYREWQLKAQPS
jgi:hypothetical protein